MLRNGIESPLDADIHALFKMVRAISSEIITMLRYFTLVIQLDELVAVQHT